MPAKSAADDVGRGDHRVGADAGKPRRLLVLPHRIQPAPVDRAMQHHAHHDRQDDQKDERVRHAVDCGPRRVAQRVRLVAVAEAARAVGGVVARRAAIDQQPAQGHDERLHLHPRDQERLQRAEHDAAEHHQQQRQRPGQPVDRQQIDEHDAKQREHRTDREVDAAGDDHQPFADRKDAEQADQVGHVEQVHAGQEAGLISAR